MASTGRPSGRGTQPASFSEPVSILQPLTYGASSCGYCSSVPGARSVAKSSKSYGAWAHALSCALYKDLLDRGWRRSGAYLYKPDMARTCCPQYTISLDANAFRPSRSQRQVLSRFAAFVRSGERTGHPGWGPPQTSTVEVGEEGCAEGASHRAGGSGGGGGESGGEASSAGKLGEGTSAALPSEAERKGGGKAPFEQAGQRKPPPPGAQPPHSSGKRDKGKGKAGASVEGDWTDLVHAGDWSEAEAAALAHRFEYILEPASYTEEKFDLFKKYQTQVHHEAEDTVTSKGFKRFLVDSPLDLEPSCSSQYQYGSHHALYRLDGQLIAFAVLDILPRAVSSVYFVWDPEYAGMSLGKISALREASMVKEMEERGAWEGGGGRYMMGFYIHTCPKMRYKADYQPSFLLDPPTNAYYPWSVCKPRLDATTSGMTTFSCPVPPPPPSTDPSPTPAPDAAMDTSTTPAPDEAHEDEDVRFEEEDDDDDLETETEFPHPPPPGCLDPDALPVDVLTEAFVIQRRTLMPLLLSDAWKEPETNREARELLATVGEPGKSRLAIFLGR